MVLVMGQEEDKRFQILAQERAARARHKHANPEGFDTEVECQGWENEDLGLRCGNLPEFHIEQLDGPCFFVCRICAMDLIVDIPPIPLIGDGRIN